jgi:putative ABC transport system permease protein
VGILLNAVRLALVSIARNGTRSLLTVLGILIGVAAVVTVTALASAAASRVGDQLDGFASNAIFVEPRPSQTGGMKKTGARLTENDAKAIAREAVSVSAVAVFLSTQGQVVRAEKNVPTSIVGVNLPYFQVRKFSVSHGEIWTESDELLKTKVCVIGATVATALFPGEDPVGQTIRVGRSPYRVIGTLDPRGTSTFGDDQDDRVMMPIGSLRTRIMHTFPGRADQIMASASSADTTVRAQKQIESILRHTHRIPQGFDNDFSVRSQAEFRAAEEGIASVLSALLLAVAGVSLLVGGVGVMNIMLVSVSERTREIGIRMSIGAREGDIRTQFLVEAVALSLVGGLAGVVLGVGGTFAIGRVLDWPVAPSGAALAVALGTSGAIGIIFGFLPARRAAKMDPIDALRAD